MACFSSEEALESAAAATLLRSPETKREIKNLFISGSTGGEGGESFERIT